MVLPVGLMPKFVCLVMNKSYHLQVQVKIAEERYFWKGELQDKNTKHFFLKLVYFKALAANWRRGLVKFIQCNLLDYRIDIIEGTAGPLAKKSRVKYKLHVFVYTLVYNRLKHLKLQLTQFTPLVCWVFSSWRVVVQFLATSCSSRGQSMR